MSPLSVCRGNHQNSALSEPPPPPPTWRSLRKVTASILVIFMGPVFSTAARRAPGTAAAASPPRNSLRLNPHCILCDIVFYFRVRGRAIVDVIEPLGVLEVVGAPELAILIEQKVPDVLAVGGM